MLLFSYGQMQQQARSFQKVANKFLRRGEDSKIDDLASQLAVVQSSGSPNYRWGWAADSPLISDRSNGGYEVSGKGHYKGVYAQVTAIWEIGHHDSKLFRLHGNASTVIRLRDDDDDATAPDLARWRMEVGSGDSPGPIFHAHVLADEAQLKPPFPKALSVPRFPSFPMTPMAAVEFVLGELFQRRWVDHLRKTTSPFTSWRSSQMAVIDCFLKWQQEAIRSDTSPLMALKMARPKEDLFVG